MTTTNQNQELQPFDALKANIAALVAPTKTIKVTDIVTSQGANEAGRQVKAFKSQVDELRDKLVRPSNEYVKRVNAYAKAILQPLDEAETHIRREMTAFAEHQEVLKQKELARIAADNRRLEAERVAAQEKEMAELKAKQAIEAAELAESSSMFGTGVDSLEGEILPAETFEAKSARETAELEEKIKIETALANTSVKQQQYDAGKIQVSRARKNVKCEIIDIDLVPTAYLMRELNSKMVVAAFKGGTKTIPGVRIWEEMAAVIK